jgi:glycosyltransferase involved in cell wall biosynthesis
MKISIITTNFNTAKYLERTIQSVLNQKGDFELEYIITDGGSTDESLSIIKKHEDKLKYISEKDKGQSDGINKGLKMATGDIVAFLNADDTYTEGALAKVVKYFEMNPECMWLTGYHRVIDENGKEIRKFITNKKNKKLNNYSLNKLLIDNCIPQPSTFWRKEIMDEIGYIDESLHFCMDLDFWIRIYKRYELHVIQEDLSEFLFSSTTKTGGSSSKTLEESERVVMKYTNNRVVIFKHKILNFLRIVLFKYVKPAYGLFKGRALK